MSNIEIVPERPILFLILIPALLLGIIPFLRIQKRRRASAKHLVPFIIHMTLIFLLTALLVGVDVTETTSERLSTKVVFAVDVSDSNIHTKDEMNNFIKSVIKESDVEKDRFAVVLFAKGIVAVRDQDSPEGLDINSSDFIKFDRENLTTTTDGTDIGKAISEASKLFSTDPGKKQNKKIIILSDGLETFGDSLAVANKIDEGIQISGAHFSIVNSDSANKEVQLLSVNTNGRVMRGGKTKVEFVINSTKRVRKAELKVVDGDREHIMQVDLEVGKQSYVLEYEPDSEGVNVIHASVNVSVNEDLLNGNNALYSWYTLDQQKKILVIDGDYYDGENRQFSQIEKSREVMQSLKEYAIEIMAPDKFPTSLEGLLDYDQIILMDVNFEDLVKVSPKAAEILQRFVEELGRGLFVSFGDNFYEMGKGENGGATYKEHPLENILPVDLKLEGEKETVAMVLVVDLSSSMKELMDGKSRFELVVEGVKKVLMLGASQEDKDEGIGFEDTDYVGVICFDSGAHVALEMAELGDMESRLEACEKVEWELRHYYYHYYLNPDGTASDIPVGQHDGDTYTKQGYKMPSGADSPRGGYDKQTGWAIKSYGTYYKWAIQEASDMLDDMNDKVMLHIKQVLFMSDGAPSDAGSGYVGMIERLANGGVKTSTIATGLDTTASNVSKQLEELKKISNAGGGDFFVAETADDLSTEIVSKAEEVTAELINERNVLPKRNSYNSSVLQGIFVKDDEEPFEIIGGYYTSTIKTGADLILYVDKMKPLYAEWELGLGKVAVFMSDLGNINWTSSMFDPEKPNGILLLSNMLDATMNKEVRATGLECEIKRTDKTITVTATTPVDLDEVHPGEKVVMQLYDSQGQEVEYVELNKIGLNKYSITTNVDKENEAYKGYIMIYDGSHVNDEIVFAVDGHYNEEYNVFNNQGSITLRSIADSRDGSVIKSGVGYFDDIASKEQEFKHDVTKPFVIAALVLFLFDILFRNIAFNRTKKETQPEMSDEERNASMRGR